MQGHYMASQPESHVVQAFGADKWPDGSQRVYADVVRTVGGTWYWDASEYMSVPVSWWRKRWPTAEAALDEIVPFVQKKAKVSK